MPPKRRCSASVVLSAVCLLWLGAEASEEQANATRQMARWATAPSIAAAGTLATIPADTSGNLAVPMPAELAQAECEKPTQPSTLASSPVTLFSVHGYAARGLWLSRVVGGRDYSHCVVVAWPAGTTNTLGQPSHVARRLRPSWFTAIANTLRRVPIAHAALVRRLVIDNRPTEHGVAPFDRADPQDERDGRTLWLHEHLFEQPNHWARGNYGSYWSYHLNSDGVTLASMTDDHDYFSPVLLHELGHLVMYHRVNNPLAANATPACARTCVDALNCDTLSQAEREMGCATAYCRPFRFVSSTENWAEQYRFYYQSAVTRALLGQGGLGCLQQLQRDDQQLGQPFAAPWEQGLPDIAQLRPTLWTSCQGKACKKF